MPRRSNLVLTDKRVRALKPKTKEYEVSDARLPGFGVRITPYGLKTFFYRYHFKGRRRRKTIGVYDVAGDLATARREAETIRGLTLLGKPPESPAQASSTPMFGEIARRWMEEYSKPRKKSWRNDQYSLERDVYPKFDHTPIDEIRPADVRDLLLQIAKRSGNSANKAHKTIRAIFNWAIEAEIVDSNPASIRRVFDPKPPKTIVSDEDLAKLWPFWLEQRTLTGAALCLYLLTGMRHSELRELKWSQVHSNRFELTDTKNGEPHTVFLSAPAQEIVSAIHETTSFSPWVFPSPATSEKPISSFDRYARWVRQESHNDQWSIQALRRTASTILARLDVDQIVIDVFLNHVLKDVTHRHYVRYRYAEKLTEATQALGDFVTDLAGPVTGFSLLGFNYGQSTKY